jgi:hypothetical protein
MIAIGRSFQRLLLLLVGIISGACGPVVKVSQMTPQSYPPKPDDAPITVFVTKTPACPYDEIGMVSASQGAFSGDETTFIAAMKVKARALGGDALILGQLGTTTEGYIQVAPGIVGAAQGKTQTGIVIRFKDPACKE